MTNRRATTHASARSNGLRFRPPSTFRTPGSAISIPCPYGIVVVALRTHHGIAPLWIACACATFAKAAPHSAATATWNKSASPCTPAQTQASEGGALASKVHSCAPASSVPQAWLPQVCGWFVASVWLVDPMMYPWLSLDVPLMYPSFACFLPLLPLPFPVSLFPPLAGHSDATP